MQTRVICPKCGQDITSRSNQADCNAIHARRCTGKRTRRKYGEKLDLNHGGSIEIGMAERIAEGRGD